MIFLWVLVSFFVVAVFLIAAVQPASIVIRRENEKDLVFRGEQYVEAIRLYQSEHGGAFPTQLEQLIKEGPKRRRYIRQLYRNPFDPEGKWILLGPGTTVVTVGENGQPIFNSSGVGQGGINQSGIGQTGVPTGLPGQIGTGTTQTTSPGSPGQGAVINKPPAGVGEVLPFKVGSQEGQPILGVFCNKHEKAFQELRGKNYYDQWFFSPLVMPPPAAPNARPQAQQPQGTQPPAKK